MNVRRNLFGARIMLLSVLFLILCMKHAHAEDTEIQFEEVTIDDIAIPELPPIEEPTLLQRVQEATSDFLDGVQLKMRETASEHYIWYASGVDLRKEVQCLAQNIYYEARGEPIEGKLAIANTTINRVRSLLYPPSICDVVWQPFQFSWTAMHRKYIKPHDQVRWEEAQLIARRALEGGRLDNLEDVTQGATNFHTVYVHPKWKKDKELEKTVKIGHHIFYRPKPMLVTQNVEPVVNRGQ